MNIKALNLIQIAARKQLGVFVASGIVSLIAFVSMPALRYHPIEIHQPNYSFC